ncbi:hypothetical protein [Streptomyces rubrogriseus]|nr:hypothetical protein [Streptomyces rubrogriseus]
MTYVLKAPRTPPRSPSAESFCREGTSCFRLGTDATGNEADHPL